MATHTQMTVCYTRPGLHNPVLLPCMVDKETLPEVHTEETQQLTCLGMKKSTTGGCKNTVSGVNVTLQPLLSYQYMSSWGVRTWGVGETTHMHGTRQKQNAAKRLQQGLHIIFPH